MLLDTGNPPYPTESVALMPLRDATLPHQTVLATNPDLVAGHPVVTCNCRMRDGLPPIAVVTDLKDTVAKYNDPAAHVGPTPFTADWMLSTHG